MIMNHPWFSATDLKSGNATYELWRQDVKCLMEQSYDRDAILNAVRKSSRGEEGMVGMRLDLDANIDDVIRKLDSIYGSVDKKEILLPEFYGSRQQNDENVSHWSCRLEGIIVFHDVVLIATEGGNKVYGS
jgi:hypothetical protein